MERYYFKVRLEEGFKPDPVGRECPSLAEAIADAKSARIEMMVEQMLDRLCIEIEDQSGQTVATIPAVRWGR